MTSRRETLVPKARLTGPGSVTRADDGVGQDRGHGAHVGEVPGLGAVAVHRERLAAEGGGR